MDSVSGMMYEGVPPAVGEGGEGGGAKQTRSARLAKMAPINHWDLAVHVLLQDPSALQHHKTRGALNPKP